MTPLAQAVEDYLALRRENPIRAQERWYVKKNFTIQSISNYTCSCEAQVHAARAPDGGPSSRGPVARDQGRAGPPWPP